MDVLPFRVTPQSKFVLKIFQMNRGPSLSGVILRVISLVRVELGPNWGNVIGTRDEGWWQAPRTLRSKGKSGLTALGAAPPEPAS